MELVDIVQFLKETPNFSHLDDKQLQQVASSISISYHKKGERLDHDEVDGIPLFLLRKGAFNTFSDSGELRDRVGEHELFSLNPQAGSEFQAHHAVALEDSLLYAIPFPLLETILGDQQNRPLLPGQSPALSLERRSSRKEHSLPLNTKVASIIKNEPITAGTDFSIRDAAIKMKEARVSSLLLTDNEKLVGILTDRDLRCRVIAKGVSPEEKIATCMTVDPVTIDQEAFVFEALMTMSRNNIHHLPVVNRDRLVGILTTTDIVRLQHDQPVYLIGEIFKADSSDSLADVCKPVPELFSNLVESGAKASEISRILTSIADAATQQLIKLAEKKLGRPPVPYCWVAFGSQARHELSVNSDQDNGLLLDDSFEAIKHGDYFEAMANFVCEGLNRCGYRFCRGGVMASNPKWRKTLIGWSAQFSQWILEPTPEATMHCSIFFDLRNIYGDENLLESLQQEILEKSAESRIFLALMARNSLQHKPPLGFFRNFVLQNDGEHKNQLDLKHNGIVPIVDLARIYSLSCQISHQNSLERLNGMIEGQHGHIGDLNNLRDCLELLGRIRFEFQSRDLRQNRKPDNFVDPRTLSGFHRQHLKQAFMLVKQSQEALKSRFPGL